MSLSDYVKLLETAVNNVIGRKEQKLDTESETESLHTTSTETASISSASSSESTASTTYSISSGKSEFDYDEKDVSAKTESYLTANNFKEYFPRLIECWEKWIADDQSNRKRCATYLKQIGKDIASAERKKKTGLVRLLKKTKEVLQERLNVSNDSNLGALTQVLGLRDVVSAAGIDDDHKLFNKFLFEFGKLQAEKGQERDNQKKEQMSEEERSFLKMEEPGDKLLKFIVKFQEIAARDNRGYYDEDVEKRFADDSATKGKIGNVEFSAAETIGVFYDRRTQEDAACVGAVKSSFDDSEEEITDVFKKELRKKAAEISLKQSAIAEENKKIKEENDRIRAANKAKAHEHLPTSLEKEKPLKMAPGSTALLCHYSKNRILNLENIGDARASLVVISSSGQSFKRLTNDHKPSDPEEMARIEANGGKVTFAKNGIRTDGILLPSRAIGDSHVSGISSESQSYRYDIGQVLASSPPGTKLFAILSCDGPFEEANEAKYLAALEFWCSDEDIRQSYDNNFAEFFTCCSVAFGSTDNNTVICIDLTEAPEAAIFAAIFDGHGGEEIARELAEYFSNLIIDKEKPHVIFPEKKELVKREDVEEKKSENKDGEQDSVAEIAKGDLDKSKLAAFSSVGDIPSGDTEKPVATTASGKAAGKKLQGCCVVS